MVGCSDMMERLGEISLNIELDTPTVEGASYTLDASRPGTSTSFRVNNITLPRHTLSSLSKGTWNLTVTAFNGDDDQIGIGNQVVDLKEGQIADVTVLVVFGQSAPLSSSFTVSAPERYNSPQGAISGTTAAMEYKLASASDETPYTACTTVSTPLAPGAYVIRYAQAHGLTASEGVTVTVPSYQPIQLTITAPTLTTTKVYDGTVALSLSVVAGTLSGVQDGDDVTVHAEGAYDTAQAGSRTITVTYSLSGADAPYYIKPVDTTHEGTITRADMTGSVSITGTAIVGQVLTAVPSLTNTNTPPTYQWNRSGTPISGATSSTYTLTKDDFFSFITVTATASGGNFQGSITSAETAQVMKAAGLSISGTISAYYPSSPATQTIINLTGFTPLLGNLEAQVAPNGTTFGNWADIEIDSRGRAMIMMLSSVTTTAKVRLRHKETDTAFAGAVKEISVGMQALAIGDYYAGGIVAYFFTAADPGFVTGELHGLIAAKADSSPSFTKWSSAANLFTIGTSTLIGTGLANTNAIIQELDERGEVGLYAAKQARSYTGGGFDDWFLPSWEELRKLRVSKILIGNFITSGSTCDYMSSSESTQPGYDSTGFYHVLPFHSDSEWVYDKEAGTHIRPVRYF